MVYSILKIEMDVVDGMESGMLVAVVVDVPWAIDGVDADVAGT